MLLIIYYVSYLSFSFLPLFLASNLNFLQIDRLVAPPSDLPTSIQPSLPNSPVSPLWIQHRTWPYPLSVFRRQPPRIFAHFPLSFPASINSLPLPHWSIVVKLRLVFGMTRSAYFIALFGAILLSVNVHGQNQTPGLNEIPPGSVTDDDQGVVPEPRGTVLDFIEASADHQVFTRLLTSLDGSEGQDGTDVYLDSPTSPSVVFAPTDSAWADYARFMFAYTGVELDSSDPDSVVDALVKGWDNLARVGPNELPNARRTVRYHVVPRRTSYPALAKKGSESTLAGVELEFYNDTIVDLDDSYNVTAGSPRYLLTNGWVVPVYQVLIPFNMSEAQRQINELESTTPTATPSPSEVTSSSPEPSFSPSASEVILPSLSPSPPEGTPVGSPSASSSLGALPPVVPSDDPIDPTITPPPGSTDGPDVSLPPMESMSPDVVPPVESASSSPSLGSPPSSSQSIGSSPSASVSTGSSPSASSSVGSDPTPSSSVGTSPTDGDANPAATEEEEDGDGICFPASAVVHMADGSRVAMKDLEAGSSVMHSEDGESSKVFLFTHRSHRAVANFRQLTTACGQTLKLTANHYLYANGRLTAAGVVRVGDIVRTVSGACAITDIRSVKEVGLFAPHSVHGDLVVNGIVVSAYSRAVSPKVAHALLAPVRWFVDASGFTEPLGSVFYNGANWALHILPRGVDKY